MGANGTGRALNQRGGQQHQQHGDNVTRGIEAQVDHVEMTTRNKDLVHLVTDRADGAKEQSEYVPESRAWAPRFAPSASKYLPASRPAGQPKSIRLCASHAPRANLRHILSSSECTPKCSCRRSEIQNVRIGAPKDRGAPTPSRASSDRTSPRTRLAALPPDSA